MGSSVILPAPGQPTTGPDPNFKGAALPQLVGFKFTGIDPPVGVYIQRDDILLILVDSFVGGNIFVSARLLLAAQGAPGQPDQQPPAPAAPQGALSPIVTVNQQFVLAGGTGLQTFTLPLQEGYLLSLRVSADSSTTSRGQTFVRVFLNRGTPAAGVTAAVLTADYLWPQQQLGWPYGQIRNTLEGPGDVRSIQVANPAAGTDWAFVCTANTRLQVRSFSSILTTSATVANRNIEVIVDDGVNILWRTSAAASVAAGITQTLSATGTNQPTGVVTTTFNVIIPPDLRLVNGWRVRTATTAIQAADQWSAIWFNVERWLDNV